MATGGTKTTKARQARMIAALLNPANRSQAAACEAAGVPVRTLQNWLSDPAFVEALRQAEEAAIGEAVRRLVAAAPAAIGVIVGVMADRENPAGIRLRAASQALDHLARLRELRDVERRLADLESQVGLTT